MSKRFFLIGLIIAILGLTGKSQPTEKVSVNFIKKEVNVLPG